MADKTTLAMPGKTLSVPRPLKRVVEVVMVLAATALVALVIVTVNTLLIGKGGTMLAGWKVWLAFIQRPDIQATMLLTAIVAVLVFYWQRDR